MILAASSCIKIQHDSLQICIMTFIEWLTSRILLPLPGREAHQRFVPAVKDADERLSPAPEGARLSAVLIPLIERDDQSIDVVFTVRSESLRSHRGQISFPGGRLDVGENHIEAAIREAREEIGIWPESISVVGTLSPLYIPPSNSAVTPVVACVQQPSTWTLSMDEVTEVFTRPLTDFLTDKHYTERNDIIPQLPLRISMWDVHPTIPLWGATAMMLHEVVMLHNEYSKEHA
jgi:8-oxo-dGTP pyrophosphatase MutT (NUDIX family)